MESNNKDLKQASLVELVDLLTKADKDMQIHQLEYERARMIYNSIVYELWTRIPTTCNEPQIQPIYNNMKEGKAHELK